MNLFENMEQPVSPRSGAHDRVLGSPSPHRHQSSQLSNGVASSSNAHQAPAVAAAAAQPPPASSSLMRDEFPPQIGMPQEQEQGGAQDALRKRGVEQEEKYLLHSDNPRSQASSLDEDDMPLDSVLERTPKRAKTSDKDEDNLTRPQLAEPSAPREKIKMKAPAEVHEEEEEFKEEGLGSGIPVSTSRSAKAGLIFPVARIAAHMKSATNVKRIGAGAPVYIASVLEYLCAEILELAGNNAIEQKKARILPRHIQLAIANDEELHKYLGHVTISQGGVVPNVHQILLPGGGGGGGSSGSGIPRGNLM